MYDKQLHQRNSTESLNKKPGYGVKEAIDPHDRSNDCDNVNKEAGRRTRMRCSFMSPKKKDGTPLWIGCGLVVAFVAVFALYWLSLFTGIYNRDSACSLPHWEYPSCDDFFLVQDGKGDPSPAYTGQEWVDLRSHYREAVAQGTGDVLSEIVLAKDWDKPGSTGFLVPFEVRSSPGMGRGLFATRPIPKGTTLWDGRYEARFPNECSAKIFFARIHNDDACYALFGGWMSSLLGNGLQYSLYLDEIVYTNHSPRGYNALYELLPEVVAQQKENRKTKGREGWKQMDPDRPVARLYATRDIEAGEEILHNYGVFSEWSLSFTDYLTMAVCNSIPVGKWWRLLLGIVTNEWY